MLFLEIIRLARPAITRHHHETLRRSKVSIIIVRDNPGREIVKNKVKIHDTPLREKIAKPDIMILIQQINITPLGPSPLTRSIGKSVTRPSRNTDRVREINLFIHQKIQRSGSKDASHPATFKH